MNSTLKQKTPLKAKTGLKTYKPLKAKKSLRDSYSEKVKAGLKQPKSRYVKAYKPKYKYSSVFTDDLDTCIITGATKALDAAIEDHHIFFGSAPNKKFSEKYGFMIPLVADWHRGTCYCIHDDHELDLYWKHKCQEYWLENIGTKEEFIKECGKWW